MAQDEMITSRRSLLAAAPVMAGALGIGLAATQQAKAEGDPKADTFERMMSTGKLRLGVANLEPYYYKDVTNSDAPGGVAQDGVTWRGMGIAIAKLVADQIGVKLEIVESTWPNAVATLQSDQADVFFFLDGTPKRATAIDFLPIPTAWTSIGLLVRDDANVVNWEDVDKPDFQIAVGQGGSPEAFLRGQLPNGKLVAFQGNAEGYAAFQSGRVNAYGGSGMELTLAQAKLGMGKVVLPKPAIGYPSGTGLRFEPGGRFKAFLTTAVSYLYYSGQIEAGYREFLAFRGIKGDNIIPIMRERW